MSLFSTINVNFGAPVIMPYKLANAQWRCVYVHTDGNFGYAVCINYFSSDFFIIAARFSDLTLCIYSNRIAGNYGGELFCANFSYCKFLGNGLFLCYNGNGSTYYVQIPSLFVPNGWIVIKPYVFNAVAPCGTGIANAAYYDSRRKLVLQSFIHSFALDTDWYANVYAANNSGLTLLTGGYIGNFPNGVNPLVKSSANSALWNFFGSSANAAPSIGVAYYASTGEISIIPTNGNPCRILAMDNVSYSSLACGVPNSDTFVNAGELFNFSSQNIVGALGQCGLCTPWPATYAALVGPPFHGVVSNINNGVIINGNFSNDAYGVFVTENAVYQLYGQLTTVRLSATPLGSGVKLPPVVNQPLSSSLLNWHRPISTRGLYKT